MILLLVFRKIVGKTTSLGEGKTEFKPTVLYLEKKMTLYYLLPIAEVLGK